MADQLDRAVGGFGGSTAWTALVSAVLGVGVCPVTVGGQKGVLSLGSNVGDLTPSISLNTSRLSQLIFVKVKMAWTGRSCP